MPGTGKYGTVYSNIKTKKKPQLEKLYSTDPQYTDYTHEALVALAQQKLVPPHQQGDLGVFPAGVDLDYRNAPDFKDVKTSTIENNKGWPMTPYTPNTMSPGADPAATGDNIATNVDPFKVGDPALTPNDIKPSFVPDTNGTIVPAETSVQIGSATVLDPKTQTLVPGKHLGSK